MKFSYKLLKQLVPKIKSKKDAIERLNLHSFEATAANGDVLDIILPPNRYDAASHIGVARELSAIYGKKLKNLFASQIDARLAKKPSVKNHQLKANFQIVVKDKKLCPRYAAQFFEINRMGQTPSWMKKILIDCGLRPINTVVDIINYAMLETGQPMHAFDFDKIKVEKTKSQTLNPKIITIRRAKAGEKITTLDNQHFNLSRDILIIADEKKPLAIAGIKGGKNAEVDVATRKIVVESANFDSANIYASSKKIKLITDASIRFSRGISPALAMDGIKRVSELLEEICGIKSNGKIIDVYSLKQPKRMLKFDVEKFNKFIGADFTENQVKNHLKLLGFEIKKSKDSMIVTVPYWRLDVENHEDLFEEVVRLYGYNNLKSKPPRVHIALSGFEDQIVLEDKIKKVLSGLGIDEAQNRSFVDSGFSFKTEHYRAVELENPISREFEYLRPNLVYNLIKNVEYNSRFFEDISIFETGKIFFKAGASNGINEINSVAVMLASKTNETFFELKGVLEELFRKIGFFDFTLIEAEQGNWVNGFTSAYLKQGEVLKIESLGKTIGYLGKVKTKGDLSKWKITAAEFDFEALLNLIEGEHEYRPLPKYPSVIRDISVLVNKSKKVGDIMQSIQAADMECIEDVDLVDEYEDNKLEGKKSLTFRIVFQAENRTLIDEEVNKDVKTIENILKNEFDAEIR